MAPDPTSLLFFLLLLHSAGAAVSPTSSPPSAPAPSSTPTPKPPAHSSPISSSTLDPKQLSALQSLNIPTSKDPCSPPPHSAATTTCDSSAPFRHLLSLTLSNCSEDVALSLTALKSLSTLTSLNFINCPVTPIRFPAELTSNLHSFTCINSLKKLTGVWLSRLQNVTELTVSRVSITASGPTIILGGMKFLHSVTLSQANLSGYLPKHWHPNLTFVDLSANHLKGKIPISLTRLENLVHLNLSSNSLNETIPTTIGDLSALQNLSLASNSLSGPIPESLAAMPWLTHLDLSFNQLNGTIPNFIRDMKKLKYLNLASNSFHGVLPFNATFIKGLEVFKVGENSNLCYNHTVLGSKVKLGIAACDKHGLPLSPPPAKDSSADDSSDDNDDDDYGNVEEKKHHNGPTKLNCGVQLQNSIYKPFLIFHNQIWEDFFSIRIPFFIFHPSLLSTHPDLGNHFFLLKLVHLAEVPDRRSIVLSIRDDGDKGRHKKKPYKADDNARSFDGNSSLSPNKEEILALFKRIQSSISKGGETVNSKRRTSRAADDNKQSSSPSTESILEVLHQSRTHRKGKSLGKNFLDAQKESLKKEESAQHFSTRPPSRFTRRSPIPTLSNPREELPSENETPSPSIPRDEIGVKNEILASTDDDDVKLAEMKLPQLKEVAKSIGIKGYSKLKKSELVELLIKAQNDASP